ncbi:endo-1,4-beta-xylanase [Clostridia bacterium]|nr:endo-1,4-beta-xylanase [Clostridia bacterium]
MFEQNTVLLHEMYRQEDMGNRRITAALKEMTEEAKRVLYLKKAHNALIARFETVPLWNGAVPLWQEGEGYAYQNRPQIAYFPALKNRHRTCVLVSPGGGFNVKSISFEGLPMVHMLNEVGIDAAILDYRVKPYTIRVSVEDIKRAVRLIRSMAGEMDIDSDHIGVQGSSAGGILSALASVHFDDGNAESTDPVERVSSRPSVAMLSYGAFSMSSQLVNGLVSVISDPEIGEMHYASPDKYVTPETPPFFMWQGSDQDDPRLMSIMIRSLAEAGVRCEAHLFPFCPHGTGMTDGYCGGYKNEHVSHWRELMLEWLAIYGF